MTEAETLGSILVVLVATHNSLHKLGGSLYLSGVCKEVLQLLALMRLDKHFTITPVEEASHEA